MDITAVLAHMEEQQQEHQAAADRWAAAIQGLRYAYGVKTPAAPAAPQRTPTRAVAAPKPSGKGQLPDALLTALKAGPMSVKDIEGKHRVSRFILRKFAREGVLTATGSTRTRRYGLPSAKSATAKEAP